MARSMSCVPRTPNVMVPDVMIVMADIVARIMVVLLTVL